MSNPLDENEKQKIFSENLEQLMERKGFGNENLAQRVGCDPKTIRRWRNGECMPTPELRPRLAEALGLAEFGELLISKEVSKEAQPGGDEPFGSRFLSRELPGTIRASEVEEFLTFPCPASHLSPFGKISSANSLSLWLWEAVRREQFLNANVFQMIGWNLGRIPLDLNQEYFEIKLPVLARLMRVFEAKGEQVCPSFVEFMRSTPTLKELYELCYHDLDNQESAISEEWYNRGLWEYILYISPPYTRDLFNPLKFRVTLYRIIESEEGKQSGNREFLAIYVPASDSASTQEIVRRKYNQFQAVADTFKYVHGPGLSLNV